MKQLARKRRSAAPHADERGAVTVVVALALTAIVGLAALGTDVGRLYLAQQRVATVADAAALSGAQLLPQDINGALQTVQTYLAKNGIDSQNVTVSLDPGKRSLSVTVDGEVDFTFAQIFGLASSKVEASAVATVANVSGYNSVVPLGVVQSDWTMGAPVVLKASPGSGGQFSPGDYGPLSLGGAGAATYEANLENGYTAWMRAGDWVSTEPGNMAGPTQRAVQARIDRDPNATFATVKKGSPRIVILPILASFTANGRGQVQVVGFGAFFLEGAGSQGNDRGTVYGRFLRYVVTGESDGSASDFATYTIKLTH